MKVIMSEKAYKEVIEEVQQATHVPAGTEKMLEGWKDSKKLIVIPDSQKIQIENWEVIGPKKMRKRYSKYLN